MALPQEKPCYTFADYLTWDENERIELIDGEPVMMAPPSRAHQEILMEIARQIANYLEGKKCKVYPAPFAVRLFEEKNGSAEDVITVVEPDITVVCDSSKLDRHGCKGAPDMVIEILSPSTARHDKFVKLHLYRRSGVKEYWIVDPVEKSVQVCLFEKGAEYPTAFYNATDIAKVNVLQGCFIELSRVFPEER